VNSQKILESEGTKPRFFYGYIVVLVGFFAIAIIQGTLNTFGVFFKPLLADFGWTRATTSGAFSLAMIFNGLLAIVMGRLTDRYGPRIVLTLCGFFLGSGYMLMSRITAIWQLYLFYGVIIGTGMGGSFVPLISIVVRWFVKRRSMMTGIVSAGIGAGTLIIPPMASRLITIYHWRTAYILLGITALILVVLAAQFLKRDPTQMGQVPYGQDELEAKTVGSGTQLFAPNEVIWGRQLLLACTMYLCVGFCHFGIMVHIVAHATEFNISATSAANILAIIGVLSIAGKVVMGIAADRIGNRPAIVIGFVLMALALFWLMAARVLWTLCVFAAVFGFAYGDCAALTSPMLAELFGISSHGLILGTASFAFSIGSAIGPLLFGYIFDISGSYQMAFLIGAAISIAGVILTSHLDPTRSTRGTMYLSNNGISVHKPGK
jgi:MFS family permease